MINLWFICDLKKKCQMFLYKIILCAMPWLKLFNDFRMCIRPWYCGSLRMNWLCRASRTKVRAFSPYFERASLFVCSHSSQLPLDWATLSSNQRHIFTYSLSAAIQKRTMTLLEAHILLLQIAYWKKKRL